jgi:hypothetical protein
MAIPFTNAVVRKLAGNHDIVLQANDAEYTKSDQAISVILFAPLTPQHGGPVPSKLPMYNVTGMQKDQPIEIKSVRYIGQTPNGNAQFTTE